MPRFVLKFEAAIIHDGRGATEEHREPISFWLHVSAVDTAAAEQAGHDATYIATTGVPYAATEHGSWLGGDDEEVEEEVEAP